MWKFYWFSHKTQNKKLYEDVVFFLIVSMITKLDDHFNYMNSINGFGNFWALKSISLIKLTEYVIFLLDAFLFVFVHVCRIIISK